jgi:peptidoglycan/LPS O-acetylase OafA/YrhL
LLALDQLRGFVIVLVVLHHAMLAYCTFGHIDRAHYALSTAPIVDAQRWAGFDFAVALNDGFFMPLLFLLSGLFVWGGLARKKPSGFLRGRLLRLALPFAVAELTVVPLAYYPSFLQAGGTLRFSAFWTQTVTMGPWPSGPPWFIAILFLFDAAATLVFVLRRRAVPAAVPRAFPAPTRCFGILLIGSILLYLPLVIAFGPTRWISFGPVAVQVSRVLLYAAYFAAGVALGANGMANIKRLGQAVANRWAGWAVLALLSSVALVGIPPLLAFMSRQLPHWAGAGCLGLALAIYCATACFAWPALFLRFGGRPGPLGTSLAANSFAIYLLHYPVVTWVQYALLSISAGAIVKGMVTLTVALVASWVAAALLRRLPGVARVI